MAAVGKVPCSEIAWQKLLKEVRRRSHLVASNLPLSLSGHYNVIRSSGHFNYLRSYQ